MTGLKTKNNCAMQADYTCARDKLTSFITDDRAARALDAELQSIENDFSQDVYPLELLYDKYLVAQKGQADAETVLDTLIRTAAEMTSQQAPDWEYIAARLLTVRFKYTLNNTMEKLAINGFYQKLTYLTEQGLYGAYILENYSEKEIAEFERALQRYETGSENRNTLFTYSALNLLLRRYVIRTRENQVLETPQEMFMGIAMHLALNEQKNKSEWVLRFYDMLSKLQVTVATPTLANARKPYHQLSSCFIDTVPDSLDGIYRSIDSFAKVSKFGGGMGLYFGKVRASGSAIRGFDGAAGGIIRWIKLANDTAVAVDQLGVRQGSVAVYLDVWHKDIPNFYNCGRTTATTA